jgi:hypothetical protein
MEVLRARHLTSGHCHPQPASKGTDLTQNLIGTGLLGCSSRWWLDRQPDLPARPPGGPRWVKSAVRSFGQFHDGHGLVATRTHAADPDGSHPGVALLAALIPQSPGVAARALVDSHGPAPALGWRRRLRRGRLVSAPPSGLAAGVRAVTAPSGRHKRAAAGLASGSHRYAIVTRRGFSTIHGCLRCCRGRGSRRSRRSGEFSDGPEHNNR